MTALPPDEPPHESSSDSPQEGVPELDPEFAEALREAGGQPAEDGEQPAEDDEGDSPQPSEAGTGRTTGDTVEYSVEQATDDKPVRTVAIGAGAEEAREAVAAADRTGRPWAPSRPPSPGDPEATPKRKRYWLHSLLASFLIVGSCASATAVAGILRLTDIVDDIQPIPGIADRLAEVDGGEPQNFLILGTDKRVATAGEKDRGLSDTTILLRVDPDLNVIAVLNIPRDLKVFIPGVGTNKFNAAYALGGPKLTLRTIQRVTAGMGLEINHLVNIDFLGFVRAINAIECVYTDVDRRYFHSNAGLPAELQYDELDIRPGYQKLCGIDALDYVRYRYTDTDLVRAARQQDFLRLARQRVPPAKLLTDQDELIDIFTAHTSSDIQDVKTMIQVMRLMIEARGAPIKEVDFPAVLGPSYVYASRPAIRDAISQFLGFEASGGPRGALESELQELESRGAEDARRGGRQGPRRSPPREKAPPAPTPESDGLVDAAQGSRDVAAGAARNVGAAFPIFFPRRLPSGTIYVSNIDVSNPYVYHLNDPDRKTHAAYRIVMQLMPQGDYIGVQGIRAWEDPPILDDPSETRTISGRDYDIYLDGDRVRMIAWREAGNSYWISNSLLQTLTNDQMLGMARSIGEITPNPKPKLRQPRKP